MSVRQSKTELIVGTLRRKILGGEFPDGRLPSCQALTEHFQFSHRPDAAEEGEGHCRRSRNGEGFPRIRRLPGCSHLGTQRHTSRHSQKTMRGHLRQCPSLVNSHAKYAEISLEYGASIKSVPYRPGAMAYFTEKGVMK